MKIVSKLFPKICLLMALTMAGGAFGQAEKLGRIVIGDPPGGGLDPLARVFSERLKDSTGRPYIVENRPGASGTIAVEAVARAAPDGTALLVAPIGPLVLEALFAAKLSYDAFRDLAPISQLTASYVVVAVGAKANATSLTDYLALAKNDPKSAFYSTAGTNGLPYILSVMLARAANVNLVNVPYKSGQQAVTSVVSGEVPAGVLPMGEVMQFYRRGQLRIIATSGDRRASLLPETPTFREQGYKDLRAETWYGLLAPAGLSQTLAESLSRAVGEILREPSSREMLANLGLEPVGSSPAQFAGAMQREREYWGPVIKASGIRRD